ncbi:hypothetical protein F5888DRAFT_790014 [Russula emetica]|nr:hypothetical protein F5888DRAFT_790014 [Russula emetica]
MSTLHPQANSPPQYFHKQLSGTSVALVCVFFCCFIGIVYLSAKAPRRATTRVIASSTARPLTARRRRPRLLEIWLDKHFDGTAVHNWLPLAAWHNDGPMRAHPSQEMIVNPHDALVQAWIRRTSTFITERRGAIELPASPPPALPPVSDPRTLNVAVLVTMPRREDTRPVPGSMVDPWDRPGLFYGEGQLELGVTSLLCEQAMSTAPEDTDSSRK